MELRDLKQFELDRVANLFRSMGYTVVSSEFKEEKIVVSFEKVFPGPGLDIRKSESDRTTIMLRSLGWAPIRSEYPGTKLVVVFEKEVKGEV